MRTAIARLHSVRRSPRRLLHAAAPSCRNRILVEPDELRTDSSGGTRVTLGAGDARARHVTEVLRAEPGQRIRVGVVDGVRASALLTGAGAEGSWALDWSAADEAPRLPAPAVDVLLALPCVPCVLDISSLPALAYACAIHVAAAGGPRLRGVCGRRWQRLASERCSSRQQRVWRRRILPASTQKLLPCVPSCCAA